MKLGLLLLRLVIGGLFVGHGAQKLFGAFGGHGPEATGAFFEKLGLRPGKQMALAAGANEAGGGALVAAGLATPVGASLISATMLVAIAKVHGEKGPWVTGGGYEYNLLILAALFALSEIGPGPLSLDHARGSDMHGVGWAVLELALAAAGATAVLKLGENEQLIDALTPADEGEAGAGEAPSA